MKLNKWTMALAAAGVVSLSSVAQAQESVSTAAGKASMTLSGYVSTSYSNDNTTDNTDDAFALDLVDLKFEGALGGSDTWAAGYTVELWMDPDANGLNTSGTTGQQGVELYQANIDLVIPFGDDNDIKLKVGQFETVVGHETSNYNANTFYTRSQAFAYEPTHHTGLLATYAPANTAGLTISAGVVNDDSTSVTNAEVGGGTAYLVKLDYTVGEGAGFLEGTVLTYGRVEGAAASSSTDKDNQYVGASIPLPIEKLSYGLAWDIQEEDSEADTNVVGHYLSYKATDDLTVHFRYEHGNLNDGTTTGGVDVGVDGLQAYTVGLDYKMWKNVTTRVEFSSVGSDAAEQDTETLVFNVIYSF